MLASLLASGSVALYTVESPKVEKGAPMLCMAAATLAFVVQWPLRAITSFVFKAEKLSKWTDDGVEWKWGCSGCDDGRLSVSFLIDA